MRSMLARAIVAYLTHAVDHPFAQVIDSAEDGAHDRVDIMLECQLPQDRAVPIQPLEPVRVLFAADESVPPRFFALRDDFPVGEVHTNLDRESDGLCLCLWEESWSDLRPILTPYLLVERMRQWMSRMATGEQHMADQHLEPLLPAAAHSLVLPAGLTNGPYHVQHAAEFNGRWTFILNTKIPDPKVGIPFSVLYLQLPVRPHGALRNRPYDLGSLIDLIVEMGGDLLGTLSAWLQEPQQLADAQSNTLLLLVYLPLQREDGGEVESYELWAYTAGDTLAALGDVLGVTTSYSVGGVLTTTPRVPREEAGDLLAVRLQGWRVLHRLDRRTARNYSGTSGGDLRLTAVGSGAIGSHVVIGSQRAGVGPWTIIDPDILSPHNIVRHVTGDEAVGFPKALVMAGYLDALHSKQDAQGIQADILVPGPAADAIAAALNQADLVIDFSASPAVLGHIGGQTDIRRAASMFFNPDGTDLVILVEAADRSVRLDQIEAQYFWASAVRPQLHGHLAAARTDRVRIANACQDLSQPLPPWQVQALSAIASGQLLQLNADTESRLHVWRMEPKSATICPSRIPVSSVVSHNGGDFTLTITQQVLDMMSRLRGDALPNETGGILIGTFDVVRNVVHVVGALAAPPDSRQSPSYFERGTADLRPKVEALSAACAGRLYYIGEWHSHPRGVPARPSNDDEALYGYLRRQLDPVGSPYAMIICGDRDIWGRVSWQARGDWEGVIHEHHDTAT